MNNLRNLRDEERIALESRGCSAEQWDKIYVSEDFSPTQLRGVRFGGVVELSSGVTITNSYIANYSIGEGSIVEDTTRLECRKESSFGNGVSVATINENGGRSVLIYDGLTAQIAYIWALYRNREALIEQLNTMAKSYAEAQRSAMGRIGARCRVVGARLLREVNLRDDVVVEGASLLEDATILSGAYIGVDVKMSEAIVAEDARVDSGATLERCFVGECAIVASGFSAIDSLIFASSHLENGEAAAIFAAPYTVSHHKSSLLIAGLFSFFNAGSGSNQSNHLFKCGAVHQAIHPRGCKFASGSYIMAPAMEGAFTMVKGYHAKHHNTSEFPYSYLIDDGGRSMLMPGANIVSYGTRRDVEKWPQRDRRKVYRDIINYEEYNPYITGAMVNAVNRLHALTEGSADADEYIHERVVIKKAHLRRGVGLYNKAIAASIGAMLSQGEIVEVDIAGKWCDLAGGYFAQSRVEQIMSAIESGEISSLNEIDSRFKSEATKYIDYAHTYAYGLLTQLLGHEPSPEEIATTIEGAQKSAEELERQIMSDMRKDNNISMAVGYGCDYDDEQIRRADFEIVRGLR